MAASVSSDILSSISLLKPAARVPLAQVPEVLRLHEVCKDVPVDGGGLHRTLDGIELSVRKGEFVSLLGPIGCAASTILRLAAGVETPTSGTVQLRNANPVTIAQHLGCSVVTNEHGLDPTATVAANLAVPFKAAGRSVDHERVATVLDVVGLAAHAERRPEQLSSEMRQRASIARALVLEPTILLLDKPFDSFDPETRWRLNLDLREICSREGVAAMLVTDDVDEAVFLADRLVMMSAIAGRIDRIRLITFEHPRRLDLLLSLDFRRVVRELHRGVHGPGGDTIDLR